MNGVKVLNTITEEIAVGKYWAFEPSFWSWFGLGCLAILVFFACWSIWKAIDESDGTWLLLTLLVLLLALIPIFCVFEHNTMEERISYQVIVDDDVHFNDFFEKYDLLDVEGIIYTVTEK